jgi:hypothetical protein
VDTRTKHTVVTLELEPLSEGGASWIGLGLSISVIRGGSGVVTVVASSEAINRCRGFSLRAGGEKVALGHIRASRGDEAEAIGASGEIFRDSTTTSRSPSRSRSSAESGMPPTAR